MVATLMRFARVAVAQGLSALLVQYGGITIPYVGLTIGAVINAIFKYLRDKFPTSPILEWLPL